MLGEPMRRREFMTVLGSAAAAWPFAARAQQPERVRRIGVLMSLAADDKESQVRLAAFIRALQDLGWTAGRDLHIDIRWGDDNIEVAHHNAAELVALAPDVMMASGSAAASSLKRATAAVPIVFVQVAEPLGGGLIESFAKPGGNVTGFASIAYGVSARWLELLKEIAPGVTRVVVVRDPDSGAGAAQFAAIESVAQSLGMELSPVGVREPSAIERAITALSGTSNGGLLVTTSTRASAHRELMLALAARHKLPAVYPFRFYVASGGLICYGVDWIDQYRRAAGYVDRILKGEKPGNLPVQTPVKYETVINLKAAKALGIDVPPTLLASADEVIE
jgi:putative tryptophan/tyrosine transport system substrate-binding protein